MEQALDVRTLIRMQSLLIAQTKVIFNKRHKSMLKLQRHGRTINNDSTLEDRNETFSDTSIIYGDDNEIENTIDAKPYSTANL